MRRRTLLGAAATAAAVPALTRLPTSPAHAAVTPQTVPALREWTAGSGSYTYHAGTRILLEPAHAGALTAAGNTFADDLQAFSGTRPAVLAASLSAAQPGDIHLTLNATGAPANDEGYRLEAGAVIAIGARTPTGVFYGTRSVLQLLVQSPSIPAGVARDWPTYPDRGVHIDSNQRRYSRAWWRNLIRDLAYLKMNQISVMLYLKGFTEAEKVELTTFAERYHVTIVPVVTMPSHTGGTINLERPDLALAASHVPANDSLDFTKPGALDAMRDWIERDIDKFPGRYWHAGADEYLFFPDRFLDWGAFPQFAQFARNVTGNSAATGQDAFTWIVNWLNGVVKAHGKTLRIWNDHLQAGGVVRLDPDIVVEYWYRPLTSNAYTAQGLINNGNPVLNFGYEYLYYDQGRNFPNPQRIYDEFRATRFVGGEVAYHPNVRGARIATWMFQASPSTPVEDNTEMFANLFGPLRSLAQVCWDSPKPGTFAVFQALYHRLGHAPGYLPLTDVVSAAAATVRNPFGRITYAARMGDQVRFGVQADPAGGFTAPVTVASGVSGPVISTADRDGRAVFFTRTASGQLVHGWQAQPGGGNWSTSVLASGVTGTPSIVLDQVGRLTYFARTTSGALVHGWQLEPGDSGQGWGSGHLTSGIAGDPVGLVDGVGRMLYFVRTTAGELRHGWHVNPGDGPWRDGILIGGLGGDPAVTIDSQGRVVYFVRTSAGELRHGWQVNVATGPWNSSILAGGIAGRPVPWVDLNGRVLYFVRTNDNRLLHGWQSQPSQGPWGSGHLASDLAGDPAVLSDPTGKVLYFARTNAGGLQHGWQLSPGAGPWNAAVLTTGVGGDPSAAVDRSGRVTYVVHAATGELWHGWQSTPGNGPWQRTTLVTS